MDQALRRRAQAEGKSLNTVAVEALVRGAGLGQDPVRRRQLGDVAGTWVEDPAFEAAVKEQGRIDRRLWR
ncbi:MAG TPA: hypothetical protein VMR21_04660 [Vicinamibacteria bacterium]|nr:hypothetical protein [Vicinamibacteria bacterium]